MLAEGDDDEARLESLSQFESDPQLQTAVEATMLTIMANPKRLRYLNLLSRQDRARAEIRLLGAIKFEGYECANLSVYATQEATMMAHHSPDDRALYLAAIPYDQRLAKEIAMLSLMPTEGRQLCIQSLVVHRSLIEAWELARSSGSDIEAYFARYDHAAGHSGGEHGARKERIQVQMLLRMQPRNRRNYLQSLLREDMLDLSSQLVDTGEQGERRLTPEQTEAFLEEFRWEDRWEVEGRMLARVSIPARCRHLSQLEDVHLEPVQAVVMARLPKEEAVEYLSAAFSTRRMNSSRTLLDVPSCGVCLQSHFLKVDKFSAEGQVLRLLTLMSRAEYLAHFTRNEIKEREAMMLSAMKPEEKAAYLYTLPTERGMIAAAALERSLSPEQIAHHRFERLGEMSDIVVETAHERAQEEGPHLTQASPAAREEYLSQLEPGQRVQAESVMLLWMPEAERREALIGIGDESERERRIADMVTELGPECRATSVGGMGREARWAVAGEICASISGWDERIAFLESFGEPERGYRQHWQRAVAGSVAGSVAKPRSMMTVEPEERTAGATEGESFLEKGREQLRQETAREERLAVELSLMEHLTEEGRAHYLVEYRFAEEMSRCEAAERETKRGEIGLLMSTDAWRKYIEGWGYLQRAQGEVFAQHLSCLLIITIYGHITLESTPSL